MHTQTIPEVRAVIRRTVTAIALAAAVVTAPITAGADTPSVQPAPQDLSTLAARTMAGYPYTGPVWTSPVDGLPADPASPGLIAAMIADMGAKGMVLDSDQYNGVVHVATPSTPKVALAHDDSRGWGKPTGWDTWATSVPLNPSWTPSKGTDAALYVADPARGVVYGLWGYTGGAKPSARAGGVTRHSAATTTAPFPMLGASTAGLTAAAGVYIGTPGPTASGLDLAAGSISPTDVAAAQRVGMFPHALYAAIPHTLAGKAVCPAVHTDGDKTTGIPEGTRLRLDITEAEIDALPTQFQQYTARTAKHFGLYIADKTGAGHPGVLTTIDNPDWWPGYLHGQQNGRLNDIPWSKLVTLTPPEAC